MSYPCVPLKELLVLHDSGVWGPEVEANGISVLRSTNFRPDGSLRFENLTYRNIELRKRASKTLEPNDIILEKSGGGPNQPVGRVCLFRGHNIAHAFGNFTARLRVERTIAEPEFLFWCLRHLHLSGGTLQYQKHTSGIRNLETKRYLSHPIPLPPLDEQRRIVAILNRAARIERLRDRAAERLREFVPALFVRMFGDPMRNPMGWSVRQIRDLCVSARYGTSKKPFSSMEGNGVPVIRMGNVTFDGYLDCADMKFVTLPNAEMEKHSLRPGDILFNRTNSKELVGKTGVWDGRFEAVAASYFIRLRLDATHVFPGYVWAFLNSASVKRQLFGMARGAIGQANINAREIQSLGMPVPPIELQSRFWRIIEQAQAISDASEPGCKGASALVESLMERLLRTSTMD